MKVVQTVKVVIGTEASTEVVTAAGGDSTSELYALLETAAIGVSSKLEEIPALSAADDVTGAG